MMAIDKQAAHRYRSIPPPMRYAVKAVTVCIAAQCKALVGADPIFVLCSDGLLDAADWGASEGGTKLYCFGWNWFAMMAGNWNSARQLCDALNDDMLAGGHIQTVDKAWARIRESAVAFASSERCERNAYCQLLITGFVGKAEPVMLDVLLHKKKATIGVVHDIHAIGEGGQAALLMFRQRPYNPLSVTAQEAIYRLYEAKRFSEVVTSVGHSTRITLHAPTRLGGKIDEACFNDLSEAGLRRLEELRLNYSIQPMDKIPEFSRDCFK
jgi:hypothetical protein